MKKGALLYSSFVVLLASCSSGKQFTTKDDDINKVKTVAVLPVQVVFTGNLPAKITTEMADSLAQVQGYSFQQSLHANLIRFSGGKNKIAGVGFQSADKTNGLLLKNHITPKDAYTKDPDELAKLLQVDAVVKMSVTSNRIMSDLASMGVSTLRNILWMGSNTIPTGMSNKTADVHANCVLIHDGKDLWSAQYDRPTDWNTSVNDVVERVTTKMGKGFPY